MASRTRTKNILALATNAQNDKVLRSGKCIDVKMAVMTRTKVKKDKPKLLKKADVSYSKTDTEIDTDLQMISQCKVITSLNNKTELQNKTLTNDFEIDTNLQENSVNYPLCNQTDSKNETFPNDTEIDTDLQMISQCKVITSLNNKTELKNKTLTNDFDSGTELIDYHVNSSSKSNVTGNERTNKITKERNPLSAEKTNKYPALRSKTYFEIDEPLFDSDTSSNYDSDSSYNPFKNKVNESFSSNDSPKSSTIGLIDERFDFNNEFTCDDDVQLCQPHNINEEPTCAIVPKSLNKINDKKAYNLLAIIETSKKTAVSNKRIWDKKDTCIFCEEEVTNFVRHLNRKHSEEIEVGKLLSLKKGSRQRKIHLDLLRKKGNFFNNISGASKLKPVRRPNQFVEQTKPTDYLPCKFCFGLFKKNYLRRHIKICIFKKVELGNERKNIQADAQSLLLAFTNDDAKLVQDVFPRMAPDEISITVKADPLIRAFGSRYLKCHKERHLVTVVSNKMRELGRLLIAMRKIKQNYRLTLLDCLVPELFDDIIESTKKIAGFNTETDQFEAPSLILKIGTSLKQCCNIAEYLLLKNSPLLKINEDVEKSITKVKTTEKLIIKQWSYELSTNASKELYQKKWNKPAFLPLTSDIKIFRDYLISIQKNALTVLKNSPTDLNAYKALQETLLAQLILLNRKRAGEVQRIFLSSYLNNSTDIPQEEVLSSLSPVELELTKKFKRIVIRGKRGRGVPILFTPKLKKAISVLISIRQTSHDSEKNEYLFGIANTKNSCLRASEVIRKLAIASGAKNPNALTSTKLRKQVATVAQLLNFSEGDVEQLANFMGHSKEIHKTFYRLPESAFQVAKVSKFLLMMEKGNVEEYRGKNLDEIDVNIDKLISDESSNEDSDISFDEEIEEQNYLDLNQPTNSKVEQTKQKLKAYCTKKKRILKQHDDADHMDPNKIENHCPTKKQNKILKKFDRVPWTDEQKALTTSYFQKHILLKKPPKKGECEEFIYKHKEIMKGKNWKKIKTFVYNIYK